MVLSILVICSLITVYRRGTILTVALPGTLDAATYRSPVLPSGIGNSSLISTLSQHIHALLPLSKRLGQTRPRELCVALSKRDTQAALLAASVPPGFSENSGIQSAGRLFRLGRRRCRQIYAGKNHQCQQEGRAVISYPVQPVFEACSCKATSH